MKIRFTEHSIDRFIERRMPKASKQEAIKEMNRLASHATPLKERTLYGDMQMLSDGIVFVVKCDRSDKIIDCTTVLFDCRTTTNPLAEEIKQFGVLPIESVVAPSRCRRRRRTIVW